MSRRVARSYTISLSEEGAVIRSLFSLYKQTMSLKSRKERLLPDGIPLYA